jgi:RNA polymerase sigma-70 factor (ECF subfamily)
MDRAQVTRALAAHVEGEEGAAARLLPIVYEELRALAARYLRGERAGISLQPTDLVHEAYLRLVKQDAVDWKGRTHFFAMAATQMRRVLVEHARAAAAVKRGGRPVRITLTEDLVATRDRSVEFLALDSALARLMQRNERQGQVAEMRLFAGLQVKEVAFRLGVSERTVKEDWRVARAWLLKEISEGGVSA